MKFNYQKLRGRIVERFGTIIEFAAAMGTTNKSVSLKLNGKAHWSQTEIVKACGLLCIDLAEIPAYFVSPEC